MTSGHSERRRMVKVGKKIVKCRVLILILSFLLLIPAGMGYLKTRVNYDILYYLPDNIDTMVGQDVLMDEFHKGAFALEVVKGMSPEEEVEVAHKIEDVKGVADVISYESLTDASIPVDMVPQKFKQYFSNGDASLMAIFFADTTSADETMDAVKEIRAVTGKNCFLSGMSSVVTDIKDLAETEMPMYVLIAAVLTCIALAIFMDSWAVPIFFMLSIGMAVIYNLGTNVFVGEISYITKALSAVLQLGVTMDYSIFLWHSYEENQLRFPGDDERAMAHAISNTFSSVAGSSTTTIAGFIALCFMSFTLGADMGIVMAKGVVFGVIACVTILPSFILCFRKLIEKSKHRTIMPNMKKLADGIVKNRVVIAVLSLILLVPAFYGYCHTPVYYNLDATLPEYLDSIKSNEVLSKEFDMNATHLVLVKSDLSSKDGKAMLKEMSDVDGVKFALGLDSVVGSAVPKDMLPSDLTGVLSHGDWQLMMVQSAYKAASDEVNQQCTELNDIIKKYDQNGMLIGEAPCTKDLITITNHDFSVVSEIGRAHV